MLITNMRGYLELIRNVMALLVGTTECLAIGQANHVGIQA